MVAASVGAVTLLLVAGLVSGGDWLGSETWIFGIPLGNFAAWGALAGWAAVPWLLARRRAVVVAAGALAVLGAAWLPVSIALFGNVHLNNAGDWPLRAWLLHTGLLIGAPVLVAAVALGLALVARRRHAPASDS